MQRFSEHVDSPSQGELRPNLASDHSNELTRHRARAQCINNCVELEAENMKYHRLKNNNNNKKRVPLSCMARDSTQQLMMFAGLSTCGPQTEGSVWAIPFSSSVAR